MKNVYFDYLNWSSIQKAESSENYYFRMNNEWKVWFYVWTTEWLKQAHVWKENWDDDKWQNKNRKTPAISIIGKRHLHNVLSSHISFPCSGTHIAKVTHTLTCEKPIETIGSQAIEMMPQSLFCVWHLAWNDNRYGDDYAKKEVRCETPTHFLRKWLAPNK